MTNYLISFSIYTMAMIGLICLALYVFKAFSGNCFSKKSSMLNIEDAMKLSARKTLYIVKAQNEKYLIAADIDRTSLIAKLEETAPKKPAIVRENKSLDLKSFDGIDSLSEFASVIDFQKSRTSKGPMMKELARKVKGL